MYPPNSEPSDVWSDIYVKDAVLCLTRQWEPWSTSVKYWLTIPLFVRSSLRDSLLLYVMSRGKILVFLTMKLELPSPLLSDSPFSPPKVFLFFFDLRLFGTQNRDPRFGMTFPRPCDRKFSITVIVVIENFILKIGQKSKSRLPYYKLHSREYTKPPENIIYETSFKQIFYSRRPCLDTRRLFFGCGGTELLRTFS
jgi:hypothetical protein